MAMNLQKKNSNFTKTKRTHTHKDKRTRLKYKNETNDNKPGNPQLVNFQSMSGICYCDDEQ